MSILPSAGAWATVADVSDLEWDEIHNQYLRLGIELLEAFREDQNGDAAYGIVFQLSQNYRLRVSVNTIDAISAIPENMRKISNWSEKYTDEELLRKVGVWYTDAWRYDDLYLIYCHVGRPIENFHYELFEFFWEAAEEDEEFERLDALVAKARLHAVESIKCSEAFKGILKTKDFRCYVADDEGLEFHSKRHISEIAGESSTKLTNRSSGHEPAGEFLRPGRAEFRHGLDATGSCRYPRTLCPKMKTAFNIESRITLDKDVITFKSTLYRDWRMPINNLRLLGESTNQDGPGLDDYFLCFATDSSGWEEASFYSEGINDFLESLGTILGTELSLGLQHSTDFASRILWPAALRGKLMFAFSDIPPTSLIGRIFGPSRTRQTFSDEAMSVLQPKA